jgi:hypothetical protein
MADRDHERTGEPEIATTTLAEIYVQQGLLDRALAMYRRVADRSPGDPRIAGRVAEIERQVEQLRAGEPVPARGPIEEPVPASFGPREEPVPATLGPQEESPTVSRESGSPPAPAPRTPRAAPAAAADAEFLAWLERR